MGQGPAARRKSQRFFFVRDKNSNRTRPKSLSPRQVNGGRTSAVWASISLGSTCPARFPSHSDAAFGRGTFDAAAPAPLSQAVINGTADKLLLFAFLLIKIRDFVVFRNYFYYCRSFFSLSVPVRSSFPSASDQIKVKRTYTIVVATPHDASKTIAPCDRPALPVTTPRIPTTVLHTLGIGSARRNDVQKTIVPIPPTSKRIGGHREVFFR